MSDLASQIKAAIAKHLSKPVEEMKDDARFEDLGADSLDYVEVVMLVEDEFGVDIPDDAADAIQTVGELVALIEKAKS